MSLITRILEAISTKVIIMDRDNKDPYMVRYMVIKNKHISLYFHRFMQSDIGDPHDHPFDFLTFVLSKGYTEQFFKPTGDKGLLTPIPITRKPFSLAFRKAENTHLVQIDKKRSLDEIEDAPLTMCIMLKRRRVWGFYKLCDDGYRWVNWLDYLGITKDDIRYEGSE